MFGIHVNQDLTSQQQRDLAFQGEFMLMSQIPAARALCQFAHQLISEAFQPFDAQTAQQQLTVENFIQRVSPLKKNFTNGQETKKLLKELLLSLGYPEETTYFDVPRLRVVPADNFLSAGVSYAYKPHRDTWYSAPQAQINFWMPVYVIKPECAMAIFPSYWQQPIQNSSENFNYDVWCSTERPKAEQLTRQDNRQHPLPLEELDHSMEMRIAGTPGDVLIFSAAHLHSTAPNDAGHTRFSIDWRAIDTRDLDAGCGAPNVDNKAKGTILKDYISLKDFSPLDLSGKNNHAQSI